MGLQDAWGKRIEPIVPALGSTLGQPMSRMAISSPVEEHNLGVAFGAGAIKRIGFSTAQVTIDDSGTDHGRGIAQLFQCVHYIALGGDVQELKPTHKPAEPLGFKPRGLRRVFLSVLGGAISTGG